MKGNHIIKNASWIIVCRLIQSVLAVVINALTARFFGPANYGLLNYAAAITSFVAPLASLGIGNVIMNELIKEPESEGEIIGTSILMTAISSVCCMLGIAAFVKLTNANDNNVLVVVVLYALLLVAQNMELIQYWFHAKLLSKYVSIASLIAYLVVSVYKIVLLATQQSIYWFAVSTSVDYFLIAAMLLVFYRRRQGQKLCCSGERALKLWRAGRSYIIPGLMGLLLAQGDRIMLRFFCGDTEVGIYSSALSISGMSSFVFSAIITSMQPLILENKNRDAKKYEENISKLYGIVTYLAIAQCIGITFLAKYIIQIMYGELYTQAIPVLRVVVWYSIFSYIGGVRAVWFLAENKQAYLWKISFFGMLFNLSMNACLIPLFGGMGAAVTTVITQIFTNIILVQCISALRENNRYLLKGLNFRRLVRVTRK